MSLRRSWRSTRRATSPRSRSTPSPTWAHISRPSRRACRTVYATLLAGRQKRPRSICAVDAVYTNTTPVDAYRGAGDRGDYLLRPSSKRGARTGRDPAELRRKNLHPQERLPVPDAGRAAVRHRRLRGVARSPRSSSPTQNFAKRRAGSEAKGRLGGVGLSCYIEACGIAPSAVVGSLGCGVGLWESANIRFTHTGVAQVFTGTDSHGQGHEDHLRPA